MSAVRAQVRERSGGCRRRRRQRRPPRVVGRGAAGQHGRLRQLRQHAAVRALRAGQRDRHEPLARRPRRHALSAKCVLLPYVTVRQGPGIRCRVFQAAVHSGSSEAGAGSALPLPLRCIPGHCAAAFCSFGLPSDAVSLKTPTAPCRRLASLAGRPWHCGLRGLRVAAGAVAVCTRQRIGARRPRQPLLAGRRAAAAAAQGRRRRRGGRRSTRPAADGGRVWQRAGRR